MAGAPIRDEASSDDGSEAGAPDVESTYLQYRREIHADDDNIYHPLPSKRAWQFTHWAKMLGSTSTAVTELLKIDGVQEDLRIPFSTADDINEVIDKKLPSRPAFKRSEIKVAGEAYEFYYRNPMECIAALYGDPEFAPYMAYAPERHYSDQDRTNRIYHQMHTGKWWWGVQVRAYIFVSHHAILSCAQVEIDKVERGGTVVPVIGSTDKTQLTLFRNKSAYPIYLTIGNIPKEIRRKPSRRAQILLGYLPTSRLTHIKNRETRRRALANVFHACMRKIFAPMKEPGRVGVPMAGGDGVVRRCHPILAAYVGDYPEQCLVACCKNGECPKGCILTAAQLGENRVFEQRDLNDVLKALTAVDRGPEAFLAACQRVGIKPVHRPFWEDLPYANIYLSVTPDVLHQLYQGMVKHVIAWIKTAFGADEIDARFARLPPNHNLRLFSSGISHLSRVSGQEHKDICRVLLGVVVGLRLPDNQSPSRLVRALRAILDFVYIAQYPSQSKDTLGYLDDALLRFHTNKAIFQDLGIRDTFNLPKLHSLLHYSSAIKLFGTTDNYSTEYSERLHIDFAKDAYRATNHKDEYPQMTLWLLRREKVMRHAMFIAWRAAGQPAIGDLEPPVIPKQLHIKIARRPTAKAVSFADAGLLYGARNFKEVFTEYVIRTNHPTLATRQVRNIVPGYRLPFSSVAAFHKVKFWHPDAQGRDDAPQTLDCIHVRPAYIDTLGRVKPGRFDTALVDEGRGGDDPVGVQGYRVAQVRLVFALSEKASRATFPDQENVPDHFAYIEWFSRFPRNPEPNHLMYRVSRSVVDDTRVTAIIPVTDLSRSVHLIPQFGPECDREWTSSNVLELCDTFFVNSFTERGTYITVY
ncbi:hypothetical protein BV25DRAFT_1813639 [Artomyces pyxidatus]|uniref:Uncharacterized protein n=1 Tax=Artomyces pyxidatus TaxID=48021 RepID=A0ACB8SJI0_9AGAM|nr:hypothetical protein BV25DRAFT_1813639 [Artomyces pyxidatus]